MEFFKAFWMSHRWFRMIIIGAALVGAGYAGGCWREGPIQYSAGHKKGLEEKACAEKTQVGDWLKKQAGRK